MSGLAVNLTPEYIGIVSALTLNNQHWYCLSSDSEQSEDCYGAGKPVHRYP